MVCATAPLISVVLPVYNGAERIGRAIASIRSQDDPHWELIVVDDGSTDGSAEAAQQSADGDARVQIVKTPHVGLVPALRKGCALAQGALLARMDADDESHPARFSSQRAWHANHPNGGLCGTQVSMTGREVGQGRRRYESWLNAVLTTEDVDRELFIECPVAHPAFMMSRDAYESVGGYREFDGPEDYDLVFRLWSAGFALGNVGSSLLAWHDSPGRLSMNSPRYSEMAFRNLKRKWLNVAKVGAGRALYQWGAGEVGKRWLREWKPGTVEAVVDIRPGKIGQTIHDHAVIRPEELPPPGECYFLVAVGTPGARAKIRAWCEAKGYTERADYRFIA